MRTILKDRVLVLVPETEVEARELADWKAAHTDHVFRVRALDAAGLDLHDLGARADACREPINIVSASRNAAARLIGNFAPTPFVLDGQRYASVESFWQGLKFDDDTERRRLALLEGPHARSEGDKKGYAATITYAGEAIPVGTWKHWRLMELACRAKFAQNPDARAALLSTGERPLQHVVRRDSKAIPGVVMADIWMRIRTALRKADLGS